MIAIPAIDLRDGACVQLVGGAYDAERVRLPDPAAVATRWCADGFRALHVVDLDAATGRGDNRAAIAAVLAASTVPAQVGGGMRDAAALDGALGDHGAARAVVGTRALLDLDWLAVQAARYPRRLVLALDVRDRTVVTHGWTRALTQPFADVLRALDDIPLAGVLVTAVHREGQLAGCDRALYAFVRERTTHDVHASGGIASLEDLRALSALGVSAAVLGMALYTGALDARAVAEEFTQ